jgi:hypothetical protein
MLLRCHIAGHNCAAFRFLGRFITIRTAQNVLDLLPGGMVLVFQRQKKKMLDT